MYSFIHYLRSLSSAAEIYGKDLLREIGAISIDRMLDIGCNNGERTLLMAKTMKSREIYGLDCNSDALSMCEDDIITVTDLPEHICSADDRPAADPVLLPLREARRRWLDPLEKEYLEKLLRRHGGNISEAARAAEIDRQTIYRMLKKYEIRNDEDRT